VPLAATLLLAGCTRDVAVTPPATSAATTEVCTALAAALPASIAGTERRTVTPATATTAAWGDPPIVLRCGVAQPAAFLPTSLVTTVDGVEWFAEQLTAGTLFTATGRTAYVEVAIPEAYEPAAVLTGLAQAVESADPLTPAGG
jgi:hypothetical protein